MMQALGRIDTIDLSPMATVDPVEHPELQVEERTHLPDEILLTFVDTKGRAAFEDRRVQSLLDRVKQLAGIELDHIAGVKPRGDVPVPNIAGAPLTARFRMQRSARTGTQRERVKDVVDTINATLHTLEYQGVIVSSASPNWIVSSAGGHGSPMGGSGTMPYPAPAGQWSLKVPEVVAWDVDSNGWPLAGDERVIVAVLDSSPGRRALADAAKRPVLKDNALLQEMAGGDVIVEWDRFAPSQDMQPRELDPQRPAREADHGLFVAGIIHRIAPLAEIHLLHVLDSSGLGHIHLLFDALDHCLALAHSGRRIVVNMSMYLSIPPGTELWSHWFGADASRVCAHLDTAANQIEALDEAVEQRVELLLDAGAVIVAAAGNDALQLRGRRVIHDAVHPQPRLPADYDGVICTVAANRAGRIAAYSNRADIPATGNCVATYGGDGKADGRVVIVPPGTPRDGMVSLYTEVDVPTGIDTFEPNLTGWVYWSGTSFATPVISGMAANVLAENLLARRANRNLPLTTQRQVLTAILSHADPPAETDLALGCPHVPVTLSQWAAG